MGRSLKQLSIRILLALIHGAEIVCRPFFYVLRPFRAVGRWIYRHILLSIYELGLTASRAAERLLQPVKNKYVYPFVNKYFLHVIMLVLAGGVVYTNVAAQEVSSTEFGEQSLLFALVRGTDNEISYIEETAAIANAPQRGSYSGDGASVSRSLSVLPDGDVDLITREDLLATTQGGTAVVKPDVSSTSSLVQGRNRVVEYTVQEGDALGTIAEHYGVTPNTILWANDITSRHLIRVGQVLKIPPVDGIVITVKKGDTLKSLADKYKGTVEQIVSYNRLSDASDIAPGQQVIIPDGQQYYAPVPVVTQPRTTTSVATPTPSVAPSTGTMLWPTTARRISQYFGWKHTGVDIDGDFGDPVWAADDGVVSKAVCQRTGYGCHVMIDHGGGKVTLYGHFQKILVEQGERVKRGQLIGEEGSTGNSTGAHVHFEVRINGKFYNPLTYIR